MSLTNFIPTLWAGTLLAALEKAHVFGAPGVISRDYEGEITGMGDSVKINSIGPITVSDYTRNTNISAAETLNDGSQTLLIDKAKYFNFQVDDVDKAQQNPKVMTEAMNKAAYALRDAMDVSIASLYTDISATNVIGSDGTPTAITTGTIAYDTLVDLKVLLDESSTPTDGRFVILPPWYHGRLLKSDHFVSFGTDPNRGVLTNGLVGRAAGFDIYISNNVQNTTATKYKIIAGHAMGWNLAEQIVEVEAYRPELRFADAVKGLHVYGMKVTRPEQLALLTANKS